MSSVSDYIAELDPQFSEISAKSSIPVDRLQALAQGADPTVSELRRIAAALNIAISDLLPNSDTQQKARLLFRRTAAKKTRRSPDSVDRLAGYVGRAFDVLAPTSVTMRFAEFDIGMATYADAEMCARRFRELFVADDQLSPLPSLPRITVSQVGVLLYLFDSNVIEGASAMIAGEPFIFLARRTFASRMLFTLAHELGHLIAWRPDPNDFAAVDIEKDIERIRPATLQQEWFADAFASNLLLPTTSVGLALKTIRTVIKAEQDAIGDIELLYLARMFSVSFEVAARRCEDLNVLPRGGAASLHDKLRRQFGSPEKRADGLGLPPRGEIQFPVVPPRLLNEAIKRINNGSLSIGRASMALNLSIPDILAIHSK